MRGGRRTRSQMKWGNAWGQLGRGRKGRGLHCRRQAQAIAPADGEPKPMREDGCLGLAHSFMVRVKNFGDIRWDVLGVCDKQSRPLPARIGHSGRQPSFRRCCLHVAIRIRCQAGQDRCHPGVAACQLRLLVAQRGQQARHAQPHIGHRV